MRFLRPVVLSTLVAAVLIAMTLTAAAPPTFAATGGSASTDVVPMDGCHGSYCGTIVNQTNRFIKVCLAWNAPGKDEAYQPTAHCKKGKIGLCEAAHYLGRPRCGHRRVLYSTRHDLLGRLGQNLPSQD